MSATRVNVGAGHRELTAVALHDAAYQAVILAINDEITKLEKRHFVSRFKRRLEGYKNRFESINVNKVDSNYLESLSGLCECVRKELVRKRVANIGLQVLGYSMVLLMIVSIILLCALAFPAVTIPSLAFAGLYGSTVASIFVGIGVEVGAALGSSIEQTKNLALKSLSSKLSLFSQPLLQGICAPASGSILKF